jgi:chromate reductase, NAD(P)H dehydrogenase (quinone)
MTRILVLAGSVRRDSLNQRLARQAAAAVTQAGGEARLIDLGDYPLPLYDGDLEAAAGVPAPALELGRLLQQHDGLMIASPEHNASVSSLLKNSIDWLSRIRAFDPLNGRTAALLAASPGSLGGVRGLYHLRAILNTLGVEVLAQQFLLPRAHQGFDTDGRLSDERQRQQLLALAQRLVGALDRRG